MDKKLYLEAVQVVLELVLLVLLAHLEDPLAPLALLEFLD
jgi:hypothetical protein